MAGKTGQEPPPPHPDHSCMTEADMKELLRSNDPVRLSWLEAVLREAGIDSLMLDYHTSLVEGSIGAIPRRVMVAAEDYPRARAVIAAAEGEAAR